MALTDPLGSNILLGGAAAETTNDNIGDGFIPEMWGEAILDSFNKNTVFAQLGTDMSGMAQAGGDVINLPHIGTPIVKDVTQAAEVLTLDVSGSDSATVTQLSLDQHKVAPLWIPDAVKIQSSYDLFNAYVGQLGYSIARAVDNYYAYQIVANLTTVLGSGDGVNANTSINVDTADALTPANLASLMGIITGETGSTDGWVLVLGPTAYGALANSSNFGNSFTQGIGGLASDFAGNGMVGNLLGMPVIASNNAYMDAGAVAADGEKGLTVWTGFDTGSSGADTADDDKLRGFCIHKDAFYHAMQQSPRVQRSYQHTYMQDLVSVDALFGGVVRSADSDGDRKIIALTDSLD